MIKNIKIWLMSMMLLTPFAGVAIDHADINKQTNIVGSFQDRYDHLRNTQDRKGLKVLRAEVKKFLDTMDSLSTSWSDINKSAVITALCVLIAIHTIKTNQIPYLTVTFATMSLLSLMRESYKFYKTESSDIILARSILAGIEESLE